MTLPQSVHSATRKILLKIKGFSEVKVEKIKEAIQKCQVGFVLSLLNRQFFESYPFNDNPQCLTKLIRARDIAFDLRVHHCC